MFKKIQSIRRISQKTRVYNFDVPKHENYIANGFVVHNCQNHKFSQNVQEGASITPRQLWATAIDRQVAGIAFTYNEPTVHFEYLMDTGMEMLRLPLNPYMRMVVKTNGFASPEVFEKLTTVVDAFNVDIKGDEASYKTHGGILSPVLDSIALLRNKAHHLEISYLVVPDVVDDIDFHIRIRDYLSELGTEIPVHVLNCFPFHKMTDSYALESLLKVVSLFKEKMEYVYVSNSFRSEMMHLRNTVCASCGEVMIDRSGPAKVLKTRCCDRFLQGFVDLD